MTAIVVHGGAGAVAAERHDRLRAGVRAAAAAGHAVLAGGGSALDAVVAAVRVLEDDPELNAGHGSALTRDGTVETDAAVMDGATRRVGAVGAVPDLGAPIALARAVLDAGEHVLLVGPAALRFAAEVGIAPAAPGALVTERARKRLADTLRDRAIGVTERAGGAIGAADRERHGAIGATEGGAIGAAGREREGGTVGAVARDRDGRFAAATSTGGISGKRAGRVGDTPVPGAGTWADDACAISATGDGEAILRVALARSIAMRARTDGPARDVGLAAAVRASLAELHRITGGSAGVIAVAASGIVALQLSPTMPVAWIAGDDTGDGLGCTIAPA